MATIEEVAPAGTAAQKVRGYVIETMLLGEDTGFEDTTSLLDAGILDSTGAMELVAFLEKDFGISVQDEEITPENLDSVERICAFVARKQHAPVSLPA
jgi:acyl carrier protein